jgi:hypothetical protein
LEKTPAYIKLSDGILLVVHTPRQDTGKERIL